MVASKPAPTERIVVARDESGGASCKVRAKTYSPSLIRMLECPNPQEAPALWAGAENRTPIRTLHSYVKNLKHN
jgi:hypothetical protein